MKVNRSGNKFGCVVRGITGWRREIDTTADATVLDILDAVGMHADGQVSCTARRIDGTVVHLIDSIPVADQVHGEMPTIWIAEPMRAGVTPDVAVCGVYANIGSMWFGPNVQMQVQCRGNYLDIVTEGLPVYGRNSMPVTLRIPRGWIVADRTKVGVSGPLDSDSVRILLPDGKSFPHPHVWDSGIPCWNGAGMKDMASLFSMHVNTLSWANVTSVSQKRGHFTSNEIVKAFGPDPWAKIDAHKAKVDRCIEPRDCSASSYFVERFPGLVGMVARCFL